MAKRFKIFNTPILLIVTIVFALLFAAVYYYLFSNLRASVEKTSTLSNETDSLVAQKENVDSLIATYSETDTDRQKINSYFVQENGIIDFITTIENLATFAGLQHDTQSVEVEEMNPVSTSHEIVHLNFQTIGSWQKTYYFLSMLSTLPFNLTLSRVNLVSSADAASTDASSSRNSNTSWTATYDFSVVKIK